MMNNIPIERGQTDRLGRLMDSRTRDYWSELGNATRKLIIRDLDVRTAKAYKCDHRFEEIDGGGVHICLECGKELLVA